MLCPSSGCHCGGADSGSRNHDGQSALAASAKQFPGRKPLRAWCSIHRWWRPWTSLSFLKASMQAYPLLCMPPHTLVLSSVALLPILLLVWLLSYPLAYANTTCCLVLAISGLLYRSLRHLSASPHHMLGGGDLDLLSRSHCSPPGDPPPLRLSSPK